MDTRQSLKRKLSQITEATSSQEEVASSTTPAVSVNPATFFHVASSSSTSNSSDAITFAEVKKAYFTALSEFYHCQDIASYKNKQRLAGWFCFVLGTIYLQDYLNSGELNDIVLQRAHKQPGMYTKMENFIKKIIFDLQFTSIGFGYKGVNSIFDHLKTDLQIYLLIPKMSNLPKNIKVKLHEMREFLRQNPKATFADLIPKSVENIAEINTALEIAGKEIVAGKIARRNNDILHTLKSLLNNHFQYIETTLGADAANFMLGLLHKTGDMIAEHLLYDNHKEIGKIFINKAAEFNYFQSIMWLKHTPEAGGISNSAFTSRKR